MRCESSCSVVSSLRRFCASRLVTLIFVEGESDGRLKHLHEMYFLNNVYNYIFNSRINRETVDTKDEMSVSGKLPHHGKVMHESNHAA